MMEVSRNAKLSLQGFVIGLSVVLIYVCSLANPIIASNIIANWIYILLAYSTLAIYCVSVKFNGYDFQVAVRACCLGLFIIAGLSLASSSWTFNLLGWYIVTLGIFHWSEYYVTAVTNPKNLSLSSYLLDHSLAYHVAVASGFLEFMLEWYFFPEWKRINLLSVIGFTLVAGGEVLRKLAMWTAGTNFNHYIRHVREDGHHLVTHGIFGYFRHPSYVGWFYWSIGTQVMLLNPFCTVMYTVASWKFFQQRVMEEELTLLYFFGDTYIDYQRRVRTGLPFILGYRIDK